MGVPWRYTHTLSAVTSGLDVHRVIGAPWRGRLTTLQVTQDVAAPGKALEGFSYALFTSARAFDEDGTLSDDAERYRLTPDFAVAPGSRSAPSSAALGLDYQYENEDTDPDDPRTYNAAFRDKLHLWIRPGGSGSKGFAVTLGVSDDLVLR